MNVLFLCINYNSDHETLKFIKGVYQQKISDGDSISVMVVDNTQRGSNLNNWTNLSSIYKSLCWLNAPTNLGYFGAARYGLNIYLQEKVLPEWIIISNVDLAFGDTEFLNKLGNIDSRQSIGIVAPAIRSIQNNKDQNPFMLYRPSAIRMQFYKRITKYFLLSFIYEFLSNFKNSCMQPFKNKKLPASNRETHPIYAPHGSFIIINKLYFKKGGTLDYPCFLFGEEIYLAETARSLGIQIIYDPGLKIEHEEHLSTGRTRNRNMTMYAAESAAFCADTYFKIL
jgi:GT2 family glycosyltransferase